MYKGWAKKHEIRQIPIKCWRIGIFMLSHCKTLIKWTEIVKLEHFSILPLSCCKIISLVGPRSSKLYFNVEPCQVQGPRGRSYTGGRCFYFVALKGWRSKRIDCWGWVRGWVER